MAVLMILLLSVLAAVSCSSTHIIPNNNSRLVQYICNYTPLRSNTEILLLSNRTYSLPAGSKCVLSHVDSLTIKAIDNSTASIVCDGECSLSFYNVTNLRLENLNLSHCGGPLNANITGDNINSTYMAMPARQNAVIFTRDCHNVTFLNISIQWYRGFAIMGWNNGGHFSIRNASVCGNNISVSGSGIFIYVPAKQGTLVLDHIVMNNNHEWNSEPANNIKSLSSHTPLISASGLTIIVVESPEMPIIANISNISAKNSSGIVAGVMVLVLVNVIISSFQISDFHAEDVSLLCNGQGGVLDLHDCMRNGVALSVYFTTNSKERCFNTTRLAYRPLYMNNISLANIESSGSAVYIGQYTDSFAQYLVHIDKLVASSIRAEKQKNSHTTGTVLYAQSLRGRPSDELCILLTNSSISNCSCPLTEFGQSYCSMIRFYHLFNATIADSNFSRNRNGPVVFSRGSDTYLSGNVTFTENYSWYKGGGLHLDQDSKLYFQEPVNATFVRNKAFIGGAVSVENIDFNMHCAIQFVSRHSYRNMSITVTMTDNMATLKGDNFYAVPLYRCELEINGTKVNETDHDKVYSQVFNANGIQKFVTEATKICFCTNGKPSCDKNNNVRQIKDNNVRQIKAYPGRTFSLQLAAADVENNLASSTVTAQFENHTKDFYLLKNEIEQSLYLNCSIVNYTIHTHDDRVRNTKLYLSVHTLSSTAYLDIEIQHCEDKIGFRLHGNKCKCKEFINKLPVNCDTKHMNITKIKNQHLWLGTTNLTGHKEQLGWSKNCPPSYCKATSVALTSGSSFCANNRKGTLCGQCDNGTSLRFASTDCGKCSDWFFFTCFYYLTGGILLVLALYLLQFTITAGTISGFIFYANLINLSDSTYFSNTGPYLFPLRFFISVFNLDPGFPLCLYDEMDQFGKTVLLYFHPIYIWTIICCIILMSHFSAKIARFTGNSSIPVLVTLVHISFFKVLQTTAMIFSGESVNLEIDNKSVFVWYHDGSQRFAKDKHIILMGIGVIISVVFIIPYAFFATTSTWLMRFPFLSKRFRPFSDAISAPFKDKYRYWFGLRLWILIIIFIISAAIKGITIYLLLYLEVIILMIFTIIQALIQPYKSFILGLLDISLMLNFGLLDACVVYTYTQHHQTQVIPVGLFVGIAFLQFVAVVVYHLKMQLGKWKVFKICKRRESEELSPFIDPAIINYGTSSSPATTTKSTVGVSQANQEDANFDVNNYPSLSPNASMYSEYREPLLSSSYSN